MMEREKVEFIESYIKVQGGDYQWSDNHGELIRCKNCKHYKEGTGMCDLYHAHGNAETWYCADGERKE